MEESKSTEVPVTAEQEKVDIFIGQILEDILPFIDEPDPILNILGTLSILYNRIKYKNIVYELNQDDELEIKMEDEYYNEMLLQ